MWTFFFPLFRFVEWKDKFSAYDSGWKKHVHARKKTAQSNADMDTCAVQ